MEVPPIFINISLEILIGTGVMIIAYYFYLFYKNKKDIIDHPRALLLLIIALILAGINRYMRAFSSIYNHEWLITINEIILFMIMVTFICLLPNVMGRMLEYKSFKEYDELLNKFAEQLNAKNILLEEVKEINHKLANRIQVIENIIYNKGWIEEQQIKLQELKDIINEFRRVYRKVDES